MAILAGETITDSVYVEDLVGDPSTLPPESVFSSATAYNPNGASITVTVSEGATTGFYTVSFPTDAAIHGTYTILLISSETDDEYTGTYDVDPAVLYSGEVGVTLGDFRLQLADDLNDHLRIYATAASDGSTWQDTNNLAESENAYMGALLRVLTATNTENEGEVRRVNSSSGINYNVTLEPLPAAVTIGDVADLFDLGGHGWRPEKYDETIRQAVRQAFPAHLVRISQQGGDVYDHDTGSVEIPSAFVGVFGLVYDDGDYLHDVRPAGRRRGEYGQGWYVDRVSRTIHVDGRWSEDMDGTEYTIHGYARHSPPTLDDDIIAVDAEWMMLTCKAKLAAQRLTDSRWNNWAVEWGRQADAVKPNIWTPRMPNTVML